MTDSTVTIGAKGLTFGGLSVGGVLLALIFALVKAPAGNELTNLRIEVARLEQRVQGEVNRVRDKVEALEGEVQLLRKGQAACRSP